MSTLENRIKLQKLVNVLKSCGIDFGYEFTWYIYGPYSSDLTHDGYFIIRNRNQIDAPAESMEISSDEQNILSQINRRVINNSDSAELIAAYLYLTEEYGTRAQEELRIRKPRYSISTIEQTINEWNRTLTNR